MVRIAYGKFKTAEQVARANAGAAPRGGSSLTIGGRKMKRLHPALEFVTVWLVLAVVLWVAWGCSLAWDIYDAGKVQYTEQFSLRGKLLVSGAVGFLATGALFGGIWIFQRLRGEAPIQLPETTRGK